MPSYRANDPEQRLLRRPVIEEGRLETLLDRIGNGTETPSEFDSWPWIV
ncbi:hypothetical protein [Natronococcus pandeyae]|nr:hypothetical protein [Natronococcus pandeyae]